MINRRELKVTLRQMDLFSASVLLFVALFIIFGFLLAQSRESDGDCAEEKDFDKMMVVAIAVMILTGGITLYSLYKIVTLIAKKIQTN